MKAKILLTTLLSVLMVGVVGCGDKPSNPAAEFFDSVPTEIDHYYSNKINFASTGIDINNKGFLADKVAKLKLKRMTDGDTAVFNLTNGEEDSYTNPLKKSYGYLTVRFLGIDTPESTSSIEGWGKKASDYGKSLLKNAEGIIVDATSINTTDYEKVEDTYKAGVRLDNNGSRWLAMIWYCPDGKDANNLENYRSYQLDMIEECYSYALANDLGENYVYTADPETEPKLYKRFEKSFGSLTMGQVAVEAETRMKLLEKGFIGNQEDPDFDYSTKPTDYTITEACAKFDELSSKGKFVRLTGVITSFVGTNFYFQDAQGTPLYVYMGINGNSLGNVFQVGDTIKISGRLASYGGQMQLSGIDWNSDETFDKVTGDKAIPMPEPIVVGSADIEKSKLDSLIGKLCKITLNIESSQSYNMDKAKSYTIKCSDVVKNLGGSWNKMSIRVNGTLAPEYSMDEIKAFQGCKVEVTAVLSIYLEEDYTVAESFPSYQMVLGNRQIDADGNLISDIKKA